MADTGAIVALLFTDLVGSTAMYDRIGDEQAETVRKAHFASLRQALVAHGGEEVKSLGDGLMVAFNSAVAAVEAAIAMQQAATSAPVPAGDGHPTEVRVGIHAGEPLRDEGDFFGVSVNTARRLCDVAEPGQILASDLIRALVSPRLRVGLRPVGELALKGIDEPVSAYEVEWAPRTEVVTVPPVLAVGSDVPFVGRAEDLERLVAIWAGVAAGDHGVVLVAGEPGIGKTRLVAELARRAGSSALLLAGRCDPELATPLGPFAEAVRVAARQWPPEVHPLMVGAGLEPLHRISGTDVGDQETERPVLFDAVLAVLRQAAAHLPVLLVIDDAHWADDSSLLLLRQLWRERLEHVLVAVTYRDTDLSRTHPLAALLADFRRETDVERLVLRGLTAENVEQLLGGSARSDPSPASSAAAVRIAEDTEGNPFFITEVIRHLVDRGRLRSDGGGGWTVSGTLEAIDVPEGIREVIGRRLSSLSPACNELLAVASVIGRHFPARLLAQVAETSLDDALDAIDEALASRVLEEEAAALATFSFSHALVREALYQELSTVRRLRLHLRIGEALRTSAGTPGEIAHHLLEAGPVGSTLGAADAALDAAEDARTRLAAFEDAAAMCRRGLAVLGDDDLGRRCDLLNLLGDSMLSAGDADGMAFVGEALAIGRRLEDPERLGRSITFAVRSGMSVDTPTYQEATRETLSLLPEGPSPMRARIRAAIALTGGFEVDAPEDAPLDRDAILSAAIASDDAEAIAYAGLAVADARINAGHPDAAKRVLDETADLLGTRVREAVLPYGARYVTIAMQRLDRNGAEDATARVVEHGKRFSALPWGHKLPVAALALLDGRLDDAHELAIELLGSPGSAEQAQALLATTSLERDEGLALLPLLETQASSSSLGAWRTALALFLIEVGRAGEAGRWLDRVERATATGRAGPIQLALASEAAAALADAAVGASAQPFLEPMTGRALVVGSFLCLGSARRYLGLCSVATGDLDAAIALFEVAIDENERLRSPLYAAHTRLDLADARRRRADAGDIDAAHSLARAAAATAAALGLARVARRAAAGGRPPATLG